MESGTVKSRLKEIFGNDRYQDAEDTLHFYSASLNGPFVKPSGIVFPVSTTEVVALLQLASEHSLKVFPISKGKNFGYGEAQGTAPGQIIVDLSRMNQIIEVNEKLAYATIQPGVTQEQLYSHLITTKSKLQLDVTGGGFTIFL